jgi:hypothetical protein
VDQTDCLYLSRLLFGYLYTTVPEYESFGIKSAGMIPTPENRSNINLKTENIEEINLLNDCIGKILIPPADLSTRPLFREGSLFASPLFRRMAPLAKRIYHLFDRQG